MLLATFDDGITDFGRRGMIENTNAVSTACVGELRIGFEMSTDSLEIAQGAGHEYIERHALGDHVFNNVRGAAVRRRVLRDFVFAPVVQGAERSGQLRLRLHGFPDPFQVAMAIRANIAAGHNL